MSGGGPLFLLSGDREVWVRYFSEFNMAVGSEYKFTPGDIQDNLIEKRPVIQGRVAELKAELVEKLRKYDDNQTNVRWQVATEAKVEFLETAQSF